MMILLLVFFLFYFPFLESLLKSSLLVIRERIFPLFTLNSGSGFNPPLFFLSLPGIFTLKSWDMKDHVLSREEVKNGYDLD